MILRLNKASARGWPPTKSAKSAIGSYANSKASHVESWIYIYKFLRKSIKLTIFDSAFKALSITSLYTDNGT